MNLLILATAAAISCAPATPDLSLSYPASNVDLGYPMPTIMVLPGDATVNCWDSLLDLGFKGDPNDGMEALYAPANVVAGKCPTYPLP